MDDLEKLTYKKLYEERQTDVAQIMDRFRNRSAIGLVRDIILQLKKYSGEDMQDIISDANIFEKDLADLEESVDFVTTIPELMDKNLDLFYRLVGDHLYGIFNPQNDARYGGVLKL